jgi:hypothetical protein
VFERFIHVVYRPFPVNDALVFINWEKYKFQQGELTSPCWMIERVIYQPGIEQSESCLCITLREQQAGKDKRFLLLLDKAKVLAKLLYGGRPPLRGGKIRGRQ